MKTFTLLFCLSISIFLANAQTPAGTTPDMNDSLAVSRWLKAKHIPALALGHIQNTKPATIKVFGEIRPGVPTQPDAVFNVASITKTITIMVTLNLVSSGTWQLDEPVAQYWTDPDVRDDPRSRKLTTRDILTHRSGFPNWRNELPGGKLAFQSDPGTKYQYSGEGFEYLRHALEGKFHRRLDQLADSIIFKPLGMKDTHFTWQAADERRFAYPFDAAGKQLEPAKNTLPNAADLLKTTVPDYCKFVLWMLKGGGLNKSLFREMASHQVQTKDGAYMGLGWAVYDPVGEGEYALSHGGHDAGVHTMVILLPKTKSALVIFTNSDNGIQLYPDLVSHYLGTEGRAIVAIEMKKKP